MSAAATLLPTIPQTAEYRYERKMPVDRISASAAIAMVLRHPAAFSEIHQQRTVNSLYFDSVNLCCMHDADAGIADRYKVRLRWYNDDPHCCLEFKVRSGLVQRKERVELPSLNAAIATHEDIRAALADSSIAAHLLQQVSSLSPTLRNAYQRRYFLSMDKRYRITVDWDVRYLPHPAMIARSPVQLSPSPVIIELKYPLDADDDVGFITNAFPMRVGRYSKYVEGLRD
jgi:SPX domain protein involved in polyphosphate accumulation